MDDNEYYSEEEAKVMEDMLSILDDIEDNVYPEDDGYAKLFKLFDKNRDWLPAIFLIYVMNRTSLCGYILSHEYNNEERRRELRLLRNILTFQRKSLISTTLQILNGRVIEFLDDIKEHQNSSIKIDNKHKEKQIIVSELVERRYTVQNIVMEKVLSVLNQIELEIIDIRTGKKLINEFVKGFLDMLPECFYEYVENKIQYLSMIYGNRDEEYIHCTLNKFYKAKIKELKEKRRKANKDSSCEKKEFPES